MNAEEARQWLDLDLSNVSIWNSDLLPRHSGPPALLELARLAVQVGEPEELDGLIDAAAALQTFFKGCDLEEWPTAQVQRGLRQVMWGCGAQVPLPETPYATDPQVAAIRDHWLREAATRYDELLLQDRWQAPLNLGPGATCRLPVLLTGSQPHTGVVAELRLRLVRHEGAHLALVPAPTSALLPLTPRFAQPLRDLSSQLRSTLQEPPKASGLPPLRQIAIAWDLSPLNSEVPFDFADGDSAGAAFALGALFLLREAAPKPWRLLLRSLPRATLRHMMVTAALRPHWAFGDVGGIDNKAEALLPLAQALGHGAGRRLRLHVAYGQEGGWLPLQEVQPEITEHPDMDELLQALARQAETMGDAQHHLLDDLLRDGDVPVQPAERLQAVTQAATPTLRPWLLRCWAQWEGETRVQATFVKLNVRENPRGEADPSLQGESFTSLSQMLQVFDARASHHAYVLTGPPGAGKTTLLRHHLQHLCREALRTLERGDTPDELPLLAPLFDLDESVGDPVAWLRQRLLASGAPDEVLQLLHPQRTPEQRPRPRLLLDGLNELPMADPSQRPRRAGAVVLAFRNGVPAAPPLLLTVRPHHIGDLPQLRLLRADVQEWGDDGIERYLQLRFPGRDSSGSEAWERHLAALRARGAEAAWQLCRTPLYLSAYADLLEAGFEQPPSDRSALFAAWLWRRLRRAKGLVPGQPPVPAHLALLDNPALLSAEDHAAVDDPSAWRTTRLRDLPLQGQLVSSLLEQAEKQWWADLDSGKPGHERGGVAVKWSQTALWLRDTTVPPTDPRHDALRQAWGAAVSALGIAVVDTVHDSFRFSHQAWGEWLASMRLLPGNPPPLTEPPGLLRRAWHRLNPAAAPPPLHPTLQRLLAQLEHSRWPKKGTRRDVDELRHQDKNADASWSEVDPQIWQQLLDQGVEVDTDELLRRTVGLPAGADREERLRELQTARADVINAGIWSPVPGTDRWRASLQTWGDHTPLRSQFGKNWTSRPGAWQVLIHNHLFAGFEDACWQWLKDRLPKDQYLRLQQQAGGLALPPPGELDEVLGLALPAAADPAGWLAWLLHHGHWQALRPALAALVQRLEGGPEKTWQQPDPVLQHLRRQLLLTLADAGRLAHRPLQQAGVLGLLQQPVLSVPAALQAAWQQQWRRAWRGRGPDVRLRWLAGDLLGRLRDNLRYDWHSEPETEATFDGALPQRSGLRPCAGLWAKLGEPGGALVPYHFGGSILRPRNEQPTWARPLPAFQAARLPVTVAEWRCFADGQGYTSADAPWWVAAGPAAQQWLRQQQQGANGRPYRPPTLQMDRYNAGLQPMVGITVFEALAYAAWAEAFYASERQGERTAGQTELQLAVPSELQWEAAARGPWLAGRWTRALAAARRFWAARRLGAVFFSHDRTRCNGPTPVGLFSASATAAGLFEAAGNVWEWCSNALTVVQRDRGWRDEADRLSALAPATLDDAVSWRALRGGACGNSASQCRPSFRFHNHPVNLSIGCGVRLVRVWPPHS